ncbi:hypothetical protein LJR219_005003 [Phenylobacterium sp. LjRoot219]|uniref:hypothetical protein n=1 Tax=Phenylobacterium sp. LjRoot219 TaxID=3342283 RepID=UPI003ECCEBBB
MTDLSLPRLPRPQILVCAPEHERLLDVVSSIEPATHGMALLWCEVMRANVIPESCAPRELVRLNSRVRYRDVVTREDCEVVVAHPREAAGERAVRVDSEVGAALIGLLPGDVFGWTDALGRTRLIRVENVAPAQARVGAVSASS